MRFRKLLKDCGKEKIVIQAENVEIKRILALLWRQPMDIFL